MAGFNGNSFFCNDSSYKCDREMIRTSSCLSLRDASNDISYDLFGSGHDLDLRSNFKFDLFRLNYISFDASPRDTHDGVQIISLPYFNSSYCRKRFP